MTNISSYQRYIGLSRYARYMPEQQRRETWEETVARYCDYFAEKFPETFPRDKAYKMIHDMEVMPSMRALMTAGKALDRDHVAGYNCSYISIDDPRAFDEALFILMNGTGLGFSVERQFVSKLPEVAEEFHNSDTVIKVKDSKIGWASSFRELLSLLWSGHIPAWDLSALRPAGAPLKTFGGRSSGPGPLDDLFKFSISLFRRAAGRKLTSVECHDLMCKIADIVVVGGVRRSALISLSNLSDDRMRHAKSGQWWIDQGHRALANNSVAYTEKPEMLQFIQEWLSLYESKSGERGIFNRVAAKRKVKELGDRRKTDYEFGCNPCITGDTLIAVADGRNAVSIEQLFNEGKDVPVYSTNIETGLVEIKMGRNPRITGFNKEVYRVTLDDGSTFSATPNHKILLKDLKYVQLRDLKAGDSIFPFNSFSENNRRNVCGTGRRLYRKQYRLINEFYNGVVDSKKYALHHVDYDPSNDRIENLKIITHEDHNYIHSLSRMGDNNPYHKMTDEWKFKFASHPGESNPKYSGYTNDELLEHGRKLFDTVGNITPKIWSNYAKENGLPQFLQNDFRFGTWANFKNQVASNHKVESIEFIGHETVYNITVDDNHNYHIITSFEDDKYMTSSGVCVKNCGEIILRPQGFCNLTEVVIRETDTVESLKEKVEMATILGTFQSTLTNFRYLRSVWKKNAEEERLLGVSLTGIMDNPMMSHPNSVTDGMTLSSVLEALKNSAIETNKLWADKLGIAPSAAITTVKPSGCTTMDTEVKTTMGYAISMKDIFQNQGYNEDFLNTLTAGTWLEIKPEMGLLPHILDENNNPQNITKLYVNGIQPVYEIEFEDGKKYKFTGNHKLKTNNGWKRVDELKDTDEIINF